MRSRFSRGACINVLIFAAIAATIAVSAIDLWRDPGWHDFRAMCHALGEIDRGASDNAYAGDRTNQILPITYPALAIRPLQPLCGSAAAQRAAWLAVLFATTAVLVRTFPELPSPHVVLLSLAAFRAATWIMWTGNIAAVEFLLLALAVRAYRRERVLSTGAWLGVAGFIRVLPLAFIPAFTAGLRRRRGAWIVGAAGLVFALLHLTAALLMPEASGEYWRALTSGFGGAMAEEAWFGSTAHPSMYSAALAIGRRTANPVRSAVVIYAVVSTALVALLAIRLLGNRDREVLWAGMVLVLLLSPRLKPYNLAMVIPAACAVTAGVGSIGRILLLITVAGVPFVAFAITGIDKRAYLLGYAQLFALLALYAAIMLRPTAPASGPVDDAR